MHRFVRHALWWLGYQAHNSSACRELRDRYILDAPPVGEPLPGIGGRR